MHDSVTREAMEVWTEYKCWCCCREFRSSGIPSQRSGIAEVCNGVCSHSRSGLHRSGELSARRCCAPSVSGERAGERRRSRQLLEADSGAGERPGRDLQTAAAALGRGRLQARQQHFQGARERGCGSTLLQLPGGGVRGRRALRAPHRGVGLPGVVLRPRERGPAVRAHNAEARPQQPRLLPRAPAHGGGLPGEGSGRHRQLGPAPALHPARGGGGSPPSARGPRDRAAHGRRLPGREEHGRDPPLLRPAAGAAAGAGQVVAGGGGLRVLGGGSDGLRGLPAGGGGARRCGGAARDGSGRGEPAEPGEGDPRRHLPRRQGGAQEGRGRELRGVPRPAVRVPGHAVPQPAQQQAVLGDAGVDGAARHHRHRARCLSHGHQQLEPRPPVLHHDGVQARPVRGLSLGQFRLPCSLPREPCQSAFCRRLRHRGGCLPVDRFHTVFLLLHLYTIRPPLFACSCLLDLLEIA